MALSSSSARPDPSQCFSCQRFYHTSAYYHLPPICIKCGAEHLKAYAVGPKSRPSIQGGPPQTPFLYVSGIRENGQISAKVDELTISSFSAIPGSSGIPLPAILGDP